MKELAHIDSLRQELHSSRLKKQKEIAELKPHDAQETKIAEIKERIKKLEAKQNRVKKVDEFNALTQEMTSSERERIATEQITSDLIDKRNLEEEILGKIKESLTAIGREQPQFGKRDQGEHPTDQSGRERTIKAMTTG